MSPEDPRHGEYRGAVAHWSDREPLCDACALAATRYSKRRKAERHATGQNRRVPSWRVSRRIEALLALGWTTQDIADAAGMTFSAAWNLGQERQPWVYRAGFEKIDAAYRQLCMTRPEGRYHTRTRNRALRKGYLPPLAWDDIDDPDEQPSLGRDHSLYRAEELIAEWDHLRRSGESIEQAARQLGVTVGAIEKAIERAGRDAA